MSEIFNEEMKGMTGHLQIVTRNIETGEIIDTFDDQNVYLEQGKTQALRAFVDGGNFRIKSIYIGSDVGTGSIMEPEQPNADYTEANQDIVYEVPSENEFYVTYPAYNQVRLTAAISGPNVMALYPNSPNVVYTSATIRTRDERAIAYRRFPPRTISELVSVDLIWTLTLN